MDLKKMCKSLSKKLSIQRLLRKNLFFILLHLLSRGENPKNYIVRKGITDICIDGCPEVLIHLLCVCFSKLTLKLKFPITLNSIVNIHEAIKCNIPVVILIRDPEQAIISSVIAHKKII